MRLRYDSKVADFVDVAMRAWRRSQAGLPGWRRDPALGAGITAGIFYLAARPPVAQGLLWAVIGLGVGAFAYPWFHTETMRRGHQRAFEEWFAGAETLPVEIEAREKGFWIAQGESEMLFPWRDIVVVEEVGREIEIGLRYAGLIVVRARAFQADSERAAFIALLREHLK
jgi:hypothetical protein